MEALELIIEEPRSAKAKPGRRIDTCDESQAPYAYPLPSEVAFSTDHWFHVDVSALIADAAYLASMEAFLEDWDVPGMEAYDEL